MILSVFKWVSADKDEDKDEDEDEDEHKDKDKDENLLILAINACKLHFARSFQGYSAWPYLVR